MLRVIIESPYAGDVEANLAYAREAMSHSISMGEAPMASHLLYPQVLNDALPKDRECGIQMGYEWMAAADKVIFYVDRGWSPGMVRALKVARTLLKKPIQVRALFSRNRVPEPLDVKELITHAQASGLTVYTFGDEK